MKTIIHCLITVYNILIGYFKNKFEDRLVKNGDFYYMSA